MKIYYLLFLGITHIYAEYNSSYLLDKGNAFYSDTKAQTLRLISPQSLSKEAEEKAQLDKVWSEAFGELSDGASYILKLEKAPKSAWLETDKEDIQQDIDSILENMIEILIGEELVQYTDKIRTFNKNISDNQKKIISYREEKLIAPEESFVSTTKSQYNEKITLLKEKNIGYTKRIEIVKSTLQKRFLHIGVLLSVEQVDVLLSRVDGNDIIQMSLLMDILKYITSQIMLLMQESQEELEEAKKYYGMHLICLELVVYIQEKYIQKVEKTYIPKINNLIKESKNMLQETKALKDADDDNKRRSIYSQNLKTQALTYETSKIYRQDLLSSRMRMKNAQSKSKADLMLSRNTYKTVMLSSQLYKLIAQSQETFSQVSQIQIPAIVPFQNEQMKEKYKELSKMIGKE